MGGITCSSEDVKEGHFVPESIGSSGIIDSIVINELKENKLIDDTID